MGRGTGASTVATEVPGGSKKRAGASSPRPAMQLDCAAFDRQNLLICLGLLVVAFAAYYPIFHNEFVLYDDDEYITQNPHVKAGLSWATVKWAFTTYDQANWHPLTWLSHALDCSIFGLSPAAHHAENVLFHALNAVLLFLFLQYATGFRWRSLMVAALFALHPINVESVAWAAERKTVLSTFFFLLAFIAYVWYTRGPRLSRYAAVFGCYALALLAKQQVITFPFLLWLWDYWPLGRIDPARRSSWFSRAVIKDKVPLLLLSLASAVLTMKAQKAGGAIKDLGRYSLLLRFETAVVSYVRYLGKAVWPSKLVALYPHPTQLYPAWQVIGALLLLVVVTAFILRARQQEYLAVGWFWFLGSMVPMIGLVQVGVQALADRYAYISFIGLFVMIVWLTAYWANAYRVSPRWLAAPSLCCLLILGLLTPRQVRYWHDTETFWSRTVALTEGNYVAHRGLAGVYRRQGKITESNAELRTVLAIRPQDPYSNMVLGDYEHTQKNYAAAIENYRVVTEQPTYAQVRAQAYANMGYNYVDLKQPLKARECFEHSLVIEPDQAPVMVQLGLIAQLGGDTPTAVQDFKRAMRLQPTDVGLLLLANALLEEGQTAESDNVLLQAEKISKDIGKAEVRAKGLLGEK